MCHIVLSDSLNEEKINFENQRNEKCCSSCRAIYRHQICPLSFLNKHPQTHVDIVLRKKQCSGVLMVQSFDISMRLF